MSAASKIPYATILYELHTYNNIIFYVILYLVNVHRLSGKFENHWRLTVIVR